MATSNIALFKQGLSKMIRSVGDANNRSRSDGIPAKIQAEKSLLSNNINNEFFIINLVAVGSEGFPKLLPHKGLNLNC